MANPLLTDISIHAPSRERQFPQQLFALRCGISIHAPSRERQHGSADSYKKVDISIHAPSRERHRASYQLIMQGLFQSTLPRGSDSGVC